MITLCLATALISFIAMIALVGLSIKGKIPTSKRITTLIYLLSALCSGAWVAGLVLVVKGGY